MSRKLFAVLLVIQILSVAVFNANAQPQRKKVAIAGESKGEVWINGEQLGEGETRDLYIGDEIKTGKDKNSSVKVRFTDSIKNRIRLTEHQKCEVTLAPDTEIGIKDLLVRIRTGDIKIEAENVRMEAETDDTSTAAVGTHFRVVSREAGTIVDVLGGQVELTRKDEKEHKQELAKELKSTKITKGCQAVVNRLLFHIDLGFQHGLDNEAEVSEILMLEFKKKGIHLSQEAKIEVKEKGRKWQIEDKQNGLNYFAIRREEQINIYDDKYKNESFMVVSYRPFPVQASLLVLPPGVSRLYGQRAKKQAITAALSTGVLAGLLYYNGKREEAVKASDKGYSNYITAVRPDEAERLYCQYQDIRRDAKLFRNREIGFAVIYGALFAYEAYWAIRTGHKYWKMTEEFRELRDTLYNPQARLEIRDKAMLARAYWYFE